MGGDAIEGRKGTHNVSTLTIIVQIAQHVFRITMSELLGYRGGEEGRAVAVGVKGGDGGVLEREGEVGGGGGHGLRSFAFP